MSIQEHAYAGSPDPRTAAEVVLHSWEARVRVLCNPSAWSGVALSLGGGALGLGLLFVIISKSIGGLYLGVGLFCGLMLIFVLVGGIIDIFGGFRVRFVLTNHGVRIISGKGARAACKTRPLWAGSSRGVSRAWPPVHRLGQSRMSVYPTPM